MCLDEKTRVCTEKEDPIFVLSKIRSKFPCSPIDEDI